MFTVSPDTIYPDFLEALGQPPATLDEALRELQSTHPSMTFCAERLALARGDLSDPCLENGILQKLLRGNVISVGSFLLYSYVDPYIPPTHIDGATAMAYDIHPELPLHDLPHTLGRIRQITAQRLTLEQFEEGARLFVDAFLSSLERTSRLTGVCPQYRVPRIKEILWRYRHYS